MYTKEGNELKDILRDHGPLKREKELFLMQNPTDENKETLYKHNLRFVVAIAREYREYNVPELDLVQEGCLQLWKTVCDLKDKEIVLTDKTNRPMMVLASRAIHGAMKKHISDTSRTVRIPRHLAEDRIKASVDGLMRAVFGRELTDKVLSDDRPYAWLDQLHDALEDVMNEFLSQKEKDIVKMFYGIDMEAEDTFTFNKFHKRWHHKGLSLTKIAEVKGGTFNGIDSAKRRAIKKLQNDTVYNILSKFI